MSDEYANAWEQIKSCKHISENNTLLIFFSRLLHDSYQQNKFSEPIPWIGMYIALASLFCTLAMLADLLHGFRNRKLWFPCKYFTLNAASLTAIAVALKLPMDLTNKMPVSAKLVSLAFMCTMMANSLPSLATLDSKELVTNIVALDILVITLVVNVCIQINTGVFSYTEDYYSIEIPVRSPIRSPITTASAGDKSFMAIIYVAVLLMLLIIHTCSSLAILKSKQILESKYQQLHETYMKDQQAEILNVEKLKEQVRNYSIMAGTGSPQFMTACSATTSASGVICALSNLLFIFTTLHRDFKSDYKWSLTVILTIQQLGVILGTIAPLLRCFADLRFKLSIKWIWNHIKVFKVETYWTQNLSEWRQISIPFSISSRKNKILFHFLKIEILSFCIGFQKIVVIACKIIALLPILLVICVLCYVHCWKWIKAMFNASENIVLGINSEQLGNNEDHRRYVLQLQDDKEVADRTLKRITKSVNRMIKKAEKQQPKKLMKLLEESNGFEGVGKYDSYHVPPLSADGYLDCWGLVLVTLTTIAISLPNIQNKVVDSLLSGVSEGLAYVFLVEESLNATDEYVNIQKEAKLLWLEVEVSHKWLGNKLKILATHVNTAEQILEWFRDTAKNTLTEVDGFRIEGLNENLFFRSISANSMYRISQTILLSYQDNIDELTQEELFAHLSSMIADILAACLTNLPQVIAIKCHTSAIEKREANVQAAARLLGKTTQIINNLQERELPSLNTDELPFIDKWHDYLKNPFP